MDRPECHCDVKDTETTCQTCSMEMSLPYWCATCERLVAEKRCLGCGLKAKKVRRPGPKTSPK